MGLYRVIAASCHGKNGKVWNHGELVEASEFIKDRFDDGRPSELVKEGFLEEVKSKEKKQREQIPKVVSHKKRGPKPGKKREKKIETASELLAESLSGT